MLIRLIKAMLGNKHSEVDECTIFNIYGLRINPRKKKDVVCGHVHKVTFNSYNTYFEDMKVLNENGYQLEEIKGE